MEVAEHPAARLLAELAETVRHDVAESRKATPELRRAAGAFARPTMRVIGYGLLIALLVLAEIGRAERRAGGA